MGIFNRIKNEQIKYRREWDEGRITAVNSDGTVDVTIDGRDYPFPSVGSSFRGRFTVGDRVRIVFVGGNRNDPQVIDFSHCRGNKTVTTFIPTSSGNWCIWNNAQFRGKWNNTNYHPDMTLEEHVIVLYKDHKFVDAKVYEGYIYTHYGYGYRDYRLSSISMSDATMVHVTFSGQPVEDPPTDLLILEEEGVPFAYAINRFSYWHYLAKYNLNTMTRVYYTIFTAYNGNWNNWIKLFYDDTRLYEVWYSGTFIRYDYLRVYDRATGALLVTQTFAYPSFDFQTNNGYLCFASEIRSNIYTLSNGSIIFPTMAYNSSSQILYEVPAFNLDDGTLAWNYKPTSHTITKQYQAYLLYWYNSYLGYYGKTFEQTYSTTNLFYYFTGMDTGDKQIRNTLIACNSTMAVVLSEETTITYNKDNTDHVWYGYDDWQQTVWAAVEYPGYSQLIRRYVEEGQGAPLMTHPDLTELRNWIMAPFDSLAFDEEPLNFSWISKKEVNLVILDIATGAVLRTITGESYLTDSGTAEDSFIVPKDQLIEDIRVASHTIEVNRTKHTMYPYEGPGFTEFMGIGDNEEPRNTTQIAQIDFWVPEFDTEKYPFDHYWLGAYIINEPSGGYIKYDEVAVEFNGDSLNLQNYGPWDDIPYMGGRWEYKCVVVTHPAEDVEFPMEKYIPTQYDFTKTMITDTHLFVAPVAGEDGRLGCFKISDPASHVWDCDVSSVDSTFLHMCCSKDRIYYISTTLPPVVTYRIYEINMSTGAIITTHTTTTLDQYAVDTYREPMIIDNALVLPGSKKLSYIGSNAPV